MTVATSTPEPLTPAVLHILMALADGERHGYGIMQAVAIQSDNTVRMGPGTLYGTIKRMLASGFIEEAEERIDPNHADERRRYYRLTGLGRDVFKNEIKRLERLLQVPAAKNVLVKENT
ncbi:MAG: helix-turn-helix transcriptional regulator [Fimbriimonas sp.]|nr:helix-turn-helix transcriptional regulator [Fimbriimonas sp.]